MLDEQLRAHSSRQQQFPAAAVLTRVVRQNTPGHRLPSARPYFRRRAAQVCCALSCCARCCCPLCCCVPGRLHHAPLEHRSAALQPLLVAVQRLLHEMYLGSGSAVLARSARPRRLLPARLPLASVRELPRHRLAGRAWRLLLACRVWRIRCPCCEFLVAETFDCPHTKSVE